MKIMKRAVRRNLRRSPKSPMKPDLICAFHAIAMWIRISVFTIFIIEILSVKKFPSIFLLEKPVWVFFLLDSKLRQNKNFLFGSLKEKFMETVKKYFILHEFPFFPRKCFFHPDPIYCVPENEEKWIQLLED